MKTDDYMDNTPERVDGTKSLVTWFIHGGKTQIHIAAANIRKARFGIFVIPVNLNLDGQDVDNPSRKQNYKHLNPLEMIHVVPWDVVWSRNTQGWNSEIVALAVITDNKHDGSSSNLSIHNTSRDVLREVKRCKLGTIGVQINDSYDYSELVFALVDLKNNDKREYMSVYLCTNGKHTEVKRFVDKIVALEKDMELPRRLVSTEMRGIFPPLKVRTKIQQDSLLDSGCESVVAAVGRDLKLNKGGITKEIDNAAGNECQTYLTSIKDPVQYWEIIHCSPGKLFEKGIKQLLFGCIPKWVKPDKNAQMSELLTKFICGCLLKADVRRYRSVAIPMLGTGRLQYPERTVLASILDGIELYAQLATVGHIEKIVIAIHSSGGDSFQMYVSELARRGNKNTKTLCKQKDADILRSTNAINKYTVVNEQHLQDQLPVEFVDVVINNRSGQDVKLTPSIITGKLMLDLDINQQHFEDVMKLVIGKCETEKITAIVYHTSRLPTTAAEMQMEGIIEAFERNKNKVYLFKVLIAVSNAEDFNTCQNVLRTKNSEQGRPKWKLGEGHFDDEVYIINDNESYVTDATRDTSNKDSALVIDMVRAEVNPGITQYLYLQSISNVEKWKQKMESVFNLKVLDRNGTMMLEGTLDSILKAEDYLEADFPNSPELSVAQTIPDQEINMPTSSHGISEVSEEPVRKKTMKESPSDKQTEKAQIGPDNRNNTWGLEHVPRKTSPSNPNDGGGAEMTTSTSTLQSYVHGNTEMQLKTPKEKIDNASHKTNLQDNGGFRTDKGIAYKFNKMSVYVYVTDITTVPTDTIVCTDDINFKHEFGLSKYISSKAGIGCVQKWRQHVSELQYCKCIVTRAGQLHYKRIIHVIRPLKHDDVLIAFNNILLKCGLKIYSIVIPTIGAGTWPDHVHDCAKHYYRALQLFSESAASETSLTEIHIVDRSKKTIDMVRSVFERLSAAPKFQEISSADCIPFDVFSSTIVVTKQSMFSFSSDIKVLTTNSHLTEESDLMKEALRLCPGFKTWLTRQKGARYGITEVRSTLGYDDLRCQHVIVAVRPWLSKKFNEAKKTEFKSDIRKTVENVLKKVTQLNGTTVAIPLVTNSDDDKVKSMCCDAMAEEIINFAPTSDRLRTFYIVTDQANYGRFCSVFGKMINPGAHVVRESSV